MTDHPDETPEPAEAPIASQFEEDAKQLAMFTQAVDARENGYLDANGWHPTWEEAAPAHPSYLDDARRTLSAILTLGYARPDADETPALTEAADDDTIYVVELRSDLFGDTMRMPVLAETEQDAIDTALAVTYNRTVVSVTRRGA